MQFLFLAIYQSKVKQGSNYDNNTRSDIAKLLNSNSKVFVDNFLESFSIFAKDKNNVIKLLSELNLIDYCMVIIWLLQILILSLIMNIIYF